MTLETTVRLPLLFDRSELEASIGQRFDRVAARFPDRTALQAGGDRWTYAQLNDHANRVARAVLERAPDPEMPVALLFEHGLLGIAAVLGVLKAGRAYCALQAQHPLARLQQLAADLGPAAVLCSPGTLAQAEALLPGRAVDVAALPALAGWRAPAVSPDALAGIYYTSGSTGKPKGVMRRQSMLLHRAWVSTQVNAVTPDDRISLCFGIGFGASVVDMVTALLNGASLHPYDAPLVGVAPLAAWLRAEQITNLHLSVALYRQFLDSLADAERFESLRRVTPSGKLYWRDLERTARHTGPDCRVVAQYSSTECGMVTVMLLDPADTGAGGVVPVGFPVADKHIRLEVEPGREAAPGEAGEVVVTSRYVSVGYWRQPELTAQRMSAAAGDPALLTIRTGDLGRWRPDGSLEFMGRRDDQLKVRGFTVNLLEIEAALARTGLAAQSALVPLGDPAGDRQIAAFIAPTAACIGPQALRNALSALLPDYMIPSRFVLVDQIPLTANGKVDVARLPPLDGARPDLETPYAAPRSDSEILLAGIWSEVLRLESVGIDDLFTDLGGNSLLAAQVAVRVRMKCGVDLPMSTLLTAGVIRRLADNLDALLREGGAAALPEGIPARPDPGQPAPLTFAQENVWFVQQLHPDSAIYNQPKLLRVRGALDAQALERALNWLAARHVALRTVVEVVEGQPRQRATDPADSAIALSQIDCRLEPDPLAAGMAHARRISQQPFNLGGDLLLRAALLPLGQDDALLLIVTHHSTGDLWSSRILFNDLAELYAADCQSRAPNLAALPAQPDDIAHWQRSRLSGGRLAALSAYWTAKLKDAPFVELPADRLRPASRQFAGERLVMDLPLSASQQSRLRRLLRDEGVTSFMLLLAVFKVLLMRLTGQADLVVGSPMTQRPHNDLEQVVGMFAGNLVLRSDLSHASTFRDALGIVRKTALEAYENQDMPFSELVRLLQPRRSLQRNPMFEIMFGLQNMPESHKSLEGLSLERLALGSGAARFEQTWLLFEQPHGLRVDLEYSTETFDPQTPRRLWSSFGTLLTAVLDNPDLTLAAAPIVNPEDMALLAAWNDTYAEYPPHAIHELFLQQAQRTPHAAALLALDGARVSYADLEQRARRVQARLAAAGLTPGGLVGVYLPRSADAVSGILAVLMSGAAFVPLDPAYPEERLKMICRDSGLAVVLTQHALLPSARAAVAGMASEPRLLALDEAGADAATPDAPTGVPSDLDAPMYVFYTSGSSGQPKGVVGHHRGMVNRLAWMWRAIPYQPGEVSAHKTSLNFGDSLWEIFGPLLAGVPSLIVPDEALKDLRILVDALKRANVTRIVLVPSLLGALLDAFPDLGARLPALRVWTSSGEALPADMARRFLQAAPGCTLLNLYGSTECSADATWNVVQPDSGTASVLIGRPVDNFKVHILDRWQQLLPPGAHGEIYLESPGLALGYHNLPDLTAQRFPRLDLPGAPARRLFRTGDLARWLPGGFLEYLGRNDTQVKVRGVRVELAEVEAALRANPGVRQAAAALAELGGQKVLAAYVAPSDASADRASLLAALRAELAARLPEAMLPASYTVLDDLPLTPSGKIDRARLPAPAQSGTTTDKVSAADPLTARMCRAWEAALGVAPIGPNDNFFMLGGHSLHAFRLANVVEVEFEQRLPVALLFQYPTPAGLAAQMPGLAAGVAVPGVVALQPRGSRPPLFIAHGFGGGVGGYFQLANRLGDDQPVYGLQSRGLDGQQEPHTTIPDLADYALNLMRHVQPRGPYHLAGFCFGGIVAYEMACRLHEQGEQVGLLAVIEGFAPRSVRPRMSLRNSRHLASYARNLPLWVSDLLQQAPGPIARQVTGPLRFGLRPMVRRVADALGQPVPGFFIAVGAGSLPRHALRTTDVHLRAQSSYLPRPYAGRLDVFRVARLSLRIAHDPLLGWGALAQGELHTHIVAGRHDSLLAGQHVDSLAAQLRALLAAV